MVHFSTRRGFTLIELSIVLVIIGLITGWIFTGQTLIGSAGARATIAQLDSYTSAVSTFREKYGYLPGDIPDPVASDFGFTARGTQAAQGDGNGLIEGYNSATTGCGYAQDDETQMFWVDLTSANGQNLNLIAGTFSTATPTGIANDISGSAFPLYMPQAKLGNGNYIYVWSGTPGGSCASSTNTGGINYFAISAPTDIGQSGGCGGCMQSNAGMSVKTAARIDAKMDDGLPLSGHAITAYISSNATSWVGSVAPPATGAYASSVTSCVDNGGVSGAQVNYSMGVSRGSGVNCALSFQFP